MDKTIFMPDEETLWFVAKLQNTSASGPSSPSSFKNVETSEESYGGNCFKKLSEGILRGKKSLYQIVKG